MELTVPFSSYKYLRLVAVIAGLLGVVSSDSTSDNISYFISGKCVIRHWILLSLSKGAHRGLIAPLIKLFRVSFSSIS